MPTDNLNQLSPYRKESANFMIIQSQDVCIRISVRVLNYCGEVLVRLSIAFNTQKGFSYSVPHHARLQFPANPFS